MATGTTTDNTTRITTVPITVASTEIDGCGVPTIPLAGVHTTNQWCKTVTKRARTGQGGSTKKKKKRKTGGGASGPTRRDWVEYWQDREASYRTQGTYDPHLDAYERFCQGAWEFKSGRQWPLAEKQSGPLFIWGEFLRFSGIPLLPGNGGNTVQAGETTDSKKQRGGDDSDSDLDGDADEGEAMAGILNPQNLSSTMEAAAKGKKFLKNPALMLKVFLSSHARARGIIWTESNLTGAPILMRFFLDFLIVNRVLPESEENAIKQESTSHVIETALKELPLTSKLARVWPDEFHKACKAQWGSKAEVFIFRTGSPIGGVTVTVAPQQTIETEEGWGSSAHNVDQGGGCWGTGNWNGNSSQGWGDNQISSAWDSRVTAGGTGGERGMVDGNRIIEVGNGGGFAATPVKDKVNEDSTRDSDTYLASIFDFLGPTALPLTHTAGIVESSVRRIKAVLPPSADTSKFPITEGLSAEAVEGYMKRTLGIVVFEPWVNWNRGEEPHLAMPKILESSRGAVKTEDTTGTREATVSTGKPIPGALPPFDPHKDEISVLVDPSHLDLFSVGMGCFCTWVQLARMADFEPQDPKKEKRKTGKMERFWYVDEALRVIPSYYTYLG